MEVCTYCFERLGIGRVGEKCQICCGLFDRIEEFVEKVKKDLEKYEFRTFQVGSRLRGSARAIEELLSLRGIEDDLKKEFNRIFAKKLSDVTSAKQDQLNPEIIVTFDLESFDYEIRVTPVYLYGRYVKRVRNISQTRWLCRVCGGRGCEVCNFTGKKYITSVEELISKPAIDAFEAEDAVLHGAGREDVDARMLGNGRPFVLEIVKPRKRYVSLKELERTINEYCKGKIEVRGLKYAKPQDVRKVKEERHVKVYRVKVVFGKEVEESKLLEALNKLVGVIRQRTPKRVLHRRADKLRIRKLYGFRLLLHKGKIAVIVFEAEAGLYIKELVSGDDGRTDPSLASLLGDEAIVEKLDVIEVR